MKTSRQQIEDAIDEVRAPVPSLRSFERLVQRMAYGEAPSLSSRELNEVRDDVTFAVAKEISRHTITPRIADKLGGIVHNKVCDLQKRSTRNRERLDSRDPLVFLKARPAKDSVEGEIQEQEEVQTVIAALETIRAQSVRDYDVIYAHTNGLSLSRHLTQCSGKPVSTDAARKALSRARARLAVVLASRAKEAS